MSEDLIYQLRLETIQLLGALFDFMQSINLNPFDLESSESSLEGVLQKIDEIAELLHSISRS